MKAASKVVQMECHSVDRMVLKMVFLKGVQLVGSMVVRKVSCWVPNSAVH